MRSLSCPRQIAAVVPLVFASSLVLAGDPVSQRSAGVAGISPAEIENDWLLQSTVRHAEPLHSRHGKQVSPEEDAAGACDGIKDGKWGFHTDAENRPWWQVDLGQRCDLDHALIFNRCDSVADRASRLTVLVSDDGKDFRQVYQHDGSVFYGHSDGKPLRASLGTAGRFVRLQLPAKNYLHLDEVEIFTDGGNENVALGKPARQSSNSTWSTCTAAPSRKSARHDSIAKAIDRGLRLGEDLQARGVEVGATIARLRKVQADLNRLPSDAPDEIRRRHYLEARWAVREMALANPLLDFDDLLFVKRVPGEFTHMSDQYYGWWSRPGGGLYLLKNFKSGVSKLVCLTEALPAGSVLRPDLCYDGKRVVFAYARHHFGLNDQPDKLNKDNVPEDAFYHIYEMHLDGTGLRRLTGGKYDDFDARYLPDGRIVFLSTRRGQAVQCGLPGPSPSADQSEPDCYVRCGGGPERPVAVYTLHVMEPDGGDVHPISAFEMFEWTPSVDASGRILYARWDYVDRWNMPFMSLWSTLPDGTGTRAVFGNYTENPHCIFEARSIPGSQKLIFTASGHHAYTGGSLVLLDPNRASDGEAAMTRLTPEVCFPESEGWPQSYFSSPYPLSETHYLVAWSPQPLPPGTPRPLWGMPGGEKDLGIYLFDAFGNLNLLYRDPAISCETPLPVRPRVRPATLSSQVARQGPQEGRMLLLDVYRGLPSVSRGVIRNLRIVGVPPKTHPTMNFPAIGLTRDDPGKVVLGTVPVEEDGSAWFRVPSGVTLFFQALDADGMAVQTMRSAVYLQPGESLTCIGCHEQRNEAPPRSDPIAVHREPSKITPGPQGSWPFDYASLVQPVLERQCVGCHQPAAEGAGFDLTAEKSYTTLADYGDPSLRTHVTTRYRQGRSTVGASAARANPLWKFLEAGHYDVTLSRDDRARLITWMDTYGQRQGHFSDRQADELRDLRRRMTAMLTE